MSYFVKGIAPPKSCGNCLHNYSSLKCKITNSEIDRDDEYKERLSDCPIVEVEEPHGRLGDLDELMTEFMDSDLDHLQRDDWREVIQIVEDAPTVIEAERSETDA